MLHKNRLIKLNNSIATYLASLTVHLDRGKRRICERLPEQREKRMYTLSEGILTCKVPVGHTLLNLVNRNTPGHVLSSLITSQQPEFYCIAS